MTLTQVYDRYHVTLWRAWGALQDWRPNVGRVDWPRWHRISARGDREFDRVEHAQNHGPTFRPLWCERCEATR